MRKILITGVAGFVGYNLVEFLKKDENNDIYGTKLNFENVEIDGLKVYNMDITNIEEVENVILEIKPDYIYHLAAQSSVKRSWDNPIETVNINVIGTINLLETIRKNNLSPKVLLIGSSEEYGATFKTIESPNEKDACIPENFYALTKNTQNQIGYIYAKTYGLHIVMTRSFNHIGIKQSPVFVVSDFCKQVAEIEKGLREPNIFVGNLDIFRDFTDVYDIVRAYTLLIDNGVIGETYNVGSNKASNLREILSKIIKMSNTEIEIKVDKDKFRKNDILKTRANTSKIYNLLKWKTTIDLEESLKNILDYWRKEV